MISKIFKKIHYRRELRVFNSLTTQINFSLEEKEEHQLNKLKKTLEVGKEIPFYKPHIEKLLINNLTYSEFCKLPFLTKNDIRNNSGMLLNNSYKKKDAAYKNTSGGSTGEPVEFMKTYDQTVFGKGNYYYANFLNGISPYDRMSIFWGALRDMNNPGKEDIIQIIKNRLKKQTVHNTFVLNEKIIYDYIDQINSYKPQAIKAYVHSLYEIAKFINKHKIKIDFKPIIHTSTGPLYPEIKSEIKDAFNNAHVFSFYGSREVGPIATGTKEEKGLEVLYDNVLVEIVDENGSPVGQGEEGEIVVTTLNNHYMPLIRFRIGDRGVKGDSSIGFGTLKLKSVLGRTIGVIYKKDGTYVDGQFFTTLFFNRRGIKNFQIVQESLDFINLNLVPLDSFDQKELDLILKEIRVELGDIKIEVNIVQEINLTSTGKIMYVYSKLQD